jgi:hypothetical protein
MFQKPEAVFVENARIAPPLITVAWVWFGQWRGHQGDARPCMRSYGLWKARIMAAYAWRSFGCVEINSAMSGAHIKNPARPEVMTLGLCFIYPSTFSRIIRYVSE